MLFFFIPSYPVVPPAPAERTVVASAFAPRIAAPASGVRIVTPPANTRVVQ